MCIYLCLFSPPCFIKVHGLINRLNGWDSYSYSYAMNLDMNMHVHVFKKTKKRERIGEDWKGEERWTTKKRGRSGWVGDSRYHTHTTLWKFEALDSKDHLHDYQRGDHNQGEKERETHQIWNLLMGRCGGVVYTTLLSRGYCSSYNGIYRIGYRWVWTSHITYQYQYKYHISYNSTIYTAETWRHPIGPNISTKQRRAPKRLTGRYSIQLTASQTDYYTASTHSSFTHQQILSPKRVWTYAIQLSTI